MRILELVTTRHTRRPSYLRMSVPALLLGGAYLVAPLGVALADDTAEDLKQLRAAIQKELADLKKREQKLHQEFLRLDQKSQLLDDQLRKLRAAGTGGPVIAAPNATGATGARNPGKAGGNGNGSDERPVPRCPARARKRSPAPPPRSSRPGKSSKPPRHCRVLAAF